MKDIKDVTITFKASKELKEELTKRADAFYDGNKSLLIRNMLQSTMEAMESQKDELV